MTGRVYEIRKSTSFSWLLFSAFWGLLADYGCGMIYFYVCSNFVLGVSVGWKVVFVNCFLLTVGEDFILCVLAAVEHRFGVTGSTDRTLWSFEMKFPIKKKEVPDQ